MAALSVDGTPMPALPNSADQINYDNTTSGLSATTVKGAVDELASEKQDKTDNSLTTTNKTIVGGINELKSGLTNVGSTVNNIDNPQEYEDFVGNYIKIGRLVIFQLQVTKSKASYTLGVIAGIKTLFSTNVAVDSANGNAPVYVTNTGNNVQIQIATGILSNKSNITGCFITE